MNKNNARDFLPLVQALADGKTIQMNHDDQGWYDITNPNFDDSPNLYRIKPEPMEIWVNCYPDGFQSGTYKTRELAELNCVLGTGAVTRRYREVIE